MSFQPTDIAYIQIFPPIGIARLGDSGFDLNTGTPDGEIEWFLPSEIPGTEDMPVSLQGKFRDANNRIKRQAVRFRVYAYQSDGTILGEITSGTDCTITWSVHVANHKAAYYEFAGEYKPIATALRNPDVQPDLIPDERSQLIVDSGIQTISQAQTPVELTGSFQGSQSAAQDVHLGVIRTDEQGRLIFIGGAGYSRSVANEDTPHFQPDIISEFDSIDWIDDTCDGWVNAEVIYASSGVVLTALQKSTIITAPPKFAWGILSPTSMYDLISNIYNEQTQWKDHEGTEFYQDIWPVMHGAYGLSWVNNDAYDGHGVAGKGNFLTMEDKLATPGTATEAIRLLREHVFGRLRLPDYRDPDQALTKYMPRLSGNNGDAAEPGQALRSGEPIQRFAALTKLQYERFAQWKDGEFSADPAPWSLWQSFDDVDLSLQPLFLTRAALEHTVGEPLYPGIEVHWSARKPEMYDFSRVGSVQEPPFRFAVPPGHICRGLSLPWQSDFDLCNTHWWPSARPDDVINIRDFSIKWPPARPDDVINIRDFSTRWPPARPDDVINIRDFSTITKQHVPVDTFVRAIAPKRRQWTRGMRETPDFPSEYFPGSTDMIRHWHKLGFVAKVPDIVIGDLNLPVWVENERMRIDDKPVFKLPF